MASCFARESGGIKYCKPVEGFLDRLWVEEEDEEGEGMRSNRRSPEAKYPYPATEPKHIQTTIQGIRTATASEAVDRPCWLRHLTGCSPSGLSLGDVVGEANPPLRFG